MRINITPYTLRFKFLAGTSRGTLSEKPTWFITVHDPQAPQVVGIGEASPLKGLSIDDVPDFEQRLRSVARQLAQQPLPRTLSDLAAILEVIPTNLPSVRFGFETALTDAMNGGQRQLYPGSFTTGRQKLPINGLIWMGNEGFMRQQITEKLAAGFTCLKMKIGAIDFERECALLRLIRQQAPASQLVLRVDANGAFAPGEAMEKLNRLAEFNMHSIEQPIAAGQPEAMRQLCQTTPLPIALDEELIGVTYPKAQAQLLDAIQPQYIILKPGLLGGLAATQQWINLANARGIGWWVTSALESNIGLNAITQFTAQAGAQGHQGLGTGQLYHNNIKSPLQITAGYIQYNGVWDVTPIMG